MSDPTAGSGPIPRLNEALEGRYAIERELGEGGMATVYLAEDLRHERKVALKVLKPELAAVVGAERFLAEIKTTASLQHPNILPLHDSGEADSFLFYAMPYVEGESLRDRLDRERQLPVDEAVRIATSVAEALDFAHGKGVIHRDIKPANILLQAGKPVIADFGIALAVGAAGGGRLTETGLSVGTPHYMSPEQATGDQSVGAATDTYALGCVLYEMLVGEPPYTGSTAQAILGKILAGEGISASRQRASVPPHVEAVIARALEKVPADRFTSVGEFAKALGDPGFRHGRVTAETGAARGWNALTLGLAASVVMLSALSAGLWFNRAAAFAPDVMRFALDLDGITPAGQGDVLISPDGGTLVVTGDAGSGSSLHIRRVNEPHFRPAPGTENAVGAEFSPDGNWVVFRDGASQSLMKVSVDGGLPLSVLRSGITNPVPADWAPDGTILFRADDALYRMEDGGTPEVVVPRNGLGETHEALPDGRGVLVGMGSEVWLYSAARDTISRLLREAVDPSYVDSGHILYGHPDGGLYAVAFDLEAMHLAGEPTPIYDDMWVGGGRAHFSVSAGGVLVYGSGRSLETELQLRMVGLDGGEEPIAIASDELLTPRWSSDGDYIAYEDEDDIFVYGVEGGGQPVQLTFEGSNSNPIWSPDDSRILFSSIRTGSLGRDLFVVDVGAEEPEMPLGAMEGYQSSRGWLRDDFVVFEDGPNGASTNISRVRVSGGEVVPYVWVEADVDDVAVSPDEAWAAYQSNETDVEEVYVDSYPEPRRAVKVTTGGGQYPQWSPDGRTLYYWREGAAGPDTLVAARVRTEPSFAVLSQEAVVVGSYVVEDWDLHPDGDRFIVSAVESVGGDEDVERYVVVLNFFEELRERMGGD